MADLGLVQEFQKGDREAFAELIRKYQNYVASIAYSSTGDVSKSEDITQETFLTAWKNHQQLSDPNNWLAWLGGITRNVLRNHFRKHSRQTPGLETNELIGTEATPDHKSMTREQSELLWSILESIPETYREPLVLFYREGQSVQSVAELLQISTDAAKQRLSRGRNLIKDEIAQFVEESLFSSKPKPALTAAILAAIPQAAKGASAKVAGPAVGAVLTSKLLMFAIGPMIGIAGAVLGCRASLKSAKSEDERKLIWRMIIVCFAEVTAFCVLLPIMGIFAPQIHGSLWFQILVWSLHTLFIVAVVFVFHRRQREIRDRLKSSQQTPSTPKDAGEADGQQAPTVNDESHSSPINPTKPEDPSLATVSTLGLRLNAISSVVGSSVFVIIMACVVGDFGLAVFWACFLAGLSTYLWHDARNQVTAPQQVRFNAKSMLMLTLPLVGMVLARWDFWIAKLPDQPQLPAGVVAFGILIFSIGLFWILENRARSLDQRIEALKN